MSVDDDVEITPIEGEEAELLRKNFSKTFCRYNGTVIHETLVSRLDQILHMDVLDEDVWVCSFPKAGTTWTQEMVWCIANDLNFDGAKATLSERYVFLDFCFIVDKNRYANHSEGRKIDALFEQRANTDAKTTQSSPRFIKTHLPYDLLPKKLRDGSTKAKVVYVTRNPRDACISSFHHRKMMGVYKGDLETFCDLFMRGLISFGPFWRHLFCFWKARQSKNNSIFLRYEDMKEDLPSVVNKVAKFFGKELDKDEVNALCDHLTFENMKNNSAVNSDALTEMMKKLNAGPQNGSFMRKGAVDQWRTELSDEIIERFEKWEKENLKDTNISYTSF